LILKRDSASRLSGEWSDDDYDVLADGVVAGRIFRAAASPERWPWMWTLGNYNGWRWPSRLVATAAENHLSRHPHTSFGVCFT
jgi:hypothetical protein